MSGPAIAFAALLPQRRRHFCRACTPRSAARLVAELEALKGRLTGERQAADSALRDADNEIVRLSTQIGDRDAEAVALRAQVKELHAALEASEARHAEAVQALERAANDDASFALSQLEEATRREHATSDLARGLETELESSRVRATAASVSKGLQTPACHLAIALACSKM